MTRFRDFVFESDDDDEVDENDTSQIYHFNTTVVPFRRPNHQFLPTLVFRNLMAAKKSKTLQRTDVSKLNRELMDRISDHKFKTSIVGFLHSLVDDPKSLDRHDEINSFYTQISRLCVCFSGEYHWYLCR